MKVSIFAFAVFVLASSACGTVPAKTPPAEPMSKDAFIVDPRDPPMVSKGTITGDMLRAIEAVIRFRKDETSAQMSPEELDTTEFFYSAFYALGETNQTRPAYVFVFIGPLLHDLLASAHQQGSRGEAQYLVDLKTGDVICWNFSSALKNVREPDRDCPEYHLMPDPPSVVSNPADHPGGIRPR